MAPHSEEVTSPPADPLYEKNSSTRNCKQEAACSTSCMTPLKLKGLLDQYKSFDVTPVIGREFPDANLADWLRAPNSDDLLRDLAITISQRGVVFFRAQDGLDDNLQKELAHRLGELTGKPSSSRLHIHPVWNSKRKLSADDEISVISSLHARQLYGGSLAGQSKKQSHKDDWHTDITFEPIPGDYAILRLIELPSTGGDTLWASGYEVYDRISTPYQKFLDTLAATYAQPGFGSAAKKAGFELYTGPRGSPENDSDSFSAVHPVVRTNPVTGWKSVFAIGHHVQHIHGLTPAESKSLLDWFMSLVVENHDLQVRHRWQKPNDLAIWDNRSTYHVATADYRALGQERVAHLAVGLGEKPYFDPRSRSRQEALQQDEEGDT